MIEGMFITAASLRSFGFRVVDCYPFFQDLAAVPFLIVVPAMAGSGHDSLLEVLGVKNVLAKIHSHPHKIQEEG